MLQVPPIKRETIEGWLVAESGLPIRVVNSVLPAGVTRIGELRKWSDQDLLNLRSLGRISLDHIHSFFRLCNQIEQGKQRFQNIREVFNICLDGPEFEVLSARYGFDRPEMAASRQWTTLQEIGDAEHKTRERVRQVEETAVRKLRSRVAAACLQPFYAYFVSFLEEHGRAAACPDLEPVRRDPILAAYNVCGILLLLCDLHPDRITFYNDFFTLLPEAAVRQVESHALAVLGKEARPVTLDEILKKAPELPHLPGAEDRRRVTGHVLDHCASVAATQDNRYFLYSSGSESFLVEILQGLERPVHYRALTNAFNERLKPLSRKGAGFVLELLNANPKCTRVDRGIYDLIAE